MGLINFSYCSTEFLLVEQFQCICRRITDMIELKFGQWTKLWFTPPPSLSDFTPSSGGMHHPLNPCNLTLQNWYQTNLKQSTTIFILKNSFENVCKAQSFCSSIKVKSRSQFHNHVDGLVQDCSNSSALAMELLQSCTKPLMYSSCSVIAVIIRNEAISHLSCDTWF